MLITFPVRYSQGEIIEVFCSMKILSLLLFTILLSITLYGQSPEDSTAIDSVAYIQDTIILEEVRSLPPALTPRQRLAYTVDSISKRKELRSANFSLYVYNLDSSKVIQNYNAEKAMVPASTMKVISTATALLVLGDSFRYNTKLEYDGVIDSNGTLIGNIYITGSGDPTFGSERFDTLTSYNAIFKRWLKAMQTLGIKHIQGAIVGDASVFSEELVPGSWLWADIGNYYGAGSSGLTFNENTCNLIFKPSSKLGRRAKYLRSEPETPGVSYINNVTTSSAKRGETVYVWGSPYTHERSLTGTVPYSKNTVKVRGSMSDPPLSCAYTFEQFLKKHNIIADSAATTDRLIALQELELNKTRTIIAQHFSPSLAEIARKTNLHSINTYAECLLRTTGYMKYGLGSTDNGVQAVEDIWQSKGVDLQDFCMHDGSGLSRQNNVTAIQLTEILAKMKGTPQFETFYNSLPIAGQTGTLRRSLKGSKAEGNLRAKSGTMNRIRSYAGYVQTSSGQMLAFTIMMNYYSANKFTIKKHLLNLMKLITELE